MDLGSLSFFWMSNYMQSIGKLSYFMFGGNVMFIGKIGFFKSCFREEFYQRNLFYEMFWVF